MAVLSPGADLEGVASLLARLRFFPASQFRESMVRLEAGTGTDLGMQGAVLGMETPAGPCGVPVEQSGHRRGKMCWFRIKRCYGCAVPQHEPCSPAGNVPTC